MVKGLLSNFIGRNTFVDSRNGLYEVTVYKLHKTVNDIDSNLPQSSCGAAVGDNTITC